MTTFTDLGLAQPLLKALAAKNYATPTPIQDQAIPPVLAGRDLIGLAQTGTGKTAAFALPILQRLAANPVANVSRGACRALILAPTRELAAQIGESFRTYGAYTGLTSTTVFGGVPINKQIKALARGIDILIATPGRLLDLVNQRAAKIEFTEILVLDEADHMLDLGFLVPIKKIVRQLPKQRQTLLFSATMPDTIADLAKEFLNEPVQVAVTPVATTAERVNQGVIHVDGAQKQELLTDLLRADATISRAIVFARTKHGANKIVAKLEEARIPAEAIHGNKSQGQRERALAAFKSGQARLLVATEIAARGIDIHDVSHVINFDLPDVPEQYVHRIGRTARAGAEGIAISFCARDERGNLRDIEKLTRQPVPVIQHALSLEPPQPGERVERYQRPARGQGRPRPQPHRPRAKRTDEQREQRSQERVQVERPQSQQRPQQSKRPPQKSRDDHRPADQRHAERRSNEQRSADHRNAEHRNGEPRNAQHRNEQRKPAPKKHNDQRGRDHGGRDPGDRRGRKGEMVWSNSGGGAPPRRRPAR